METAAADGTIVAVQDVLLELERQDDDVFAWAKRHVTFMPLEYEIQASATEILTKCPQLVNTRRSRSVADPFVIALERVQGLTVVTAERASGSPQKPRIPDVCAGVGVKCVVRSSARHVQGAGLAVLIEMLGCQADSTGVQRGQRIALLLVLPPERHGPNPPLERLKGAELAFPMTTP